ncbi:glycosyltransferase [Ferroplasma sp.]|uniref:glycosyltransferase n=1 Tax=Ferroplasma sp. TaxID=2591003 RepID=UPI00307CE4FC
MDILQAIGLAIIAIGLVYVIYQFPILYYGYKEFTKYDIDFSELDEEKFSGLKMYKPLVTIIVPAKDEESVIGRTIESILNQKYKNFELFVVIDNSSDNTYKIAKEYETRDKRVKVFNRPDGKSKASALNFCFKMSSGEIIATYDADTVLLPNTLENAVYGMNYFNVDVLQGYNSYINRDENIFTRLAVIDEILVKATLIGRTHFNLFVPVAGSNQYFKRKVIQNIGGWDEKFLTEDLESSLRISNARYKSAYLSSAKALQETPASYSEYFKQRTRWLRGYHQVFLHSKKKLSKFADFDVLMIVLAPTFSGILFFGWLYISLLNFYNPFVHSMRTYFISLILISLGIYAAALILVLIKKRQNLIYIPLIYIYLTLNSLISIYTFFLEITGAKRVWHKVKKTGKTTL